MKAFVIQMISGICLEENIQTAAKLITQAKEQGASLVLLPENFAFMGKKESDKLAIAESINQGEIQELIAKLAAKHELWIIAGTIAIKNSLKAEKARASSLVFDNKGKLVSRYDKIHLFDVTVGNDCYRESDVIEPGNEVVTVDTPIGCVGLSVCYDLRFPELYQRLREQGATIFTVPAAFTAATGLAHWQVLLRARAIENLSYVLASNQGGAHQNGRNSYGHSMIVDPWGNIITQVSLGDAVIGADIDLDKLESHRQQFPCNQHHRL